MSYLPIPPRVWSRVQSQCTYIDPSSSYNSAYIPLTNQTVSLGQALYEDKLQYKGNILQYKGNSSRLTKTQKYTQLAKGFGPNRRKVYATQSQTYTNPNTSSFQRVNYNTLPSPTIVPNPFDCSSNVLQDGGNLVCGTYQQPCTGEVTQTSPSEPLCFPSYCSDVPGEPINLCWNPKAQTWFPRQRTTMNNSTNKWPINYKGLVSAVKPVSPYLMIDLSGNIAILTWKPIYANCIPISSFNIYKNGILIQNVPYTTTSITIQLCDGNTIFYVTALSGLIESDPSNIVNANPLLFFSITGDVSGNYTYTGSYYIITFQNSNAYNQITSSYNITFNQNINNLNYVIVGGGGGGGSDGPNDKHNNGGGGGAGGCISSGSINVTCGNSYSINVGYGGKSQSSNDLDGIIGGTSSFASYSVNGGTGGKSYLNGGTGGVGTSGGYSGGKGGIFSPSANATNGGNSTVKYKIPPNQPDLSNNMFYFSGGGSGGSYNGESGTLFGGFGGGGAGGFSTGYNNGFPYYGPNGIFYPAGNTSINGLISTGGGGAGQNGKNSPGGNVGTGGSGIVVLYFKYP